MIEILTTLRRAECMNCGGPLVELQGDLSQTPHWTHETTLKAHCAHAPLAEPVPFTVRDA